MKRKRTSSQHNNRQKQKERKHNERPTTAGDAKTATTPNRIRTRSIRTPPTSQSTRRDIATDEEGMGESMAKQQQQERANRRRVVCGDWKNPQPTTGARIEHKTPHEQAGTHTDHDRRWHERDGLRSGEFELFTDEELCVRGASRAWPTEEQELANAFLRTNSAKMGRCDNMGRIRQQLCKGGGKVYLNRTEWGADFIIARRGDTNSAMMLRQMEDGTLRRLKTWEWPGRDINTDLIQTLGRMGNKGTLKHVWRSKTENDNLR